MDKVDEYTISRTKATGYGTMAGVLIGVFNALFQPIDFTITVSLGAWLLSAIIAVVIIHESVHGLVALLLGHRPLFGCRPPLVYVTFTNRIPRGRFITIALAPLVILDLAFGALFFFGILKTFSYMCLIINSIGAVGDIWVVLKLLPHERSTLVQDTSTGFEVWK